MEQQMCMIACSALGEGGALIIGLIGIVWGAWQRRGKLAAVQEKAKVETERDAFKELSLRPPAAPVFFPVPQSLLRPSQPTTPAADDSEFVHEP